MAILSIDWRKHENSPQDLEAFLEGSKEKPYPRRIPVAVTVKCFQCKHLYCRGVCLAAFLRFEGLLVVAVYWFALCCGCIYILESMVLWPLTGTPEGSFQRCRIRLVRGLEHLKSYASRMCPELAD